MTTQDRGSDVEYQVRAAVSGVDEFTRGYLECAEWCGLDSDEQREALELAVRPQWDANTIRRTVAVCREFQAENADALSVYYRERSESDAGHDFWLTRNRHGAGFWDGRVSDADAAERLTDAAHVYGEANVWFDEAAERLHLEG